MADPSGPISTAPVRVAVTHLVEQDKRKAFEEKLKEVMGIASHYPGFLGTEIIQKSQGHRSEYNVFYRFDTLEHYAAWNESKRKLGLVGQLHQLTVSSRKTFLSGLETWFALGADQPMVPPPKYKMALSTWLGVYFLLMLIFIPFGTWLFRIPLGLRFLIVSFIIVFLMTYLVMPILTRVLGRWLYPGQRGDFKP